MDDEDVKEWKILESFPHKDKIFKMYHTESEVAILTSDGSLYLGLFVNNPTKKVGNWVPIPASNNQKFIDFTSSGKHILAISVEGFLFSCGGNKKQELGRQNNTQTLHQVDKLLGIRVAKITCGDEFSFAQTQDGRLFEWGVHGFKRYELTWPSEDCKSEEALEESVKEVASIHCSAFYPMVLTRGGKIFIPVLPYTYTDNNKVYHEKLQMIGGDLRNKHVIQIVTGKSLAFALTNTGEIYKWKMMEELTDDPEPVVVADMKRSVKLWASTSKDILVALGSNGYLGSLCYSDAAELLSTSRLNFKSTWSYFSHIRINFDGCVYSKNEVNFDDGGISEMVEQWKERLESIFNKEEDSDLTFEVEGQVIFAHQTIVNAQCSYLKALVKNWADDSKRIIIKKYTYPTFLRLLMYIYTGKLEHASHESNLEFLQLTHEYNESVLLKKCEKMAVNGLTVENVFTTYTIARLLDLQNLRTSCKSFISRNLEEVFFNEGMDSQDGQTLLCGIRDMIASGNIKGNVE